MCDIVEASSELKFRDRRWNRYRWNVVSGLQTAHKPWYIFSPDFVEMTTFLTCNASAILPILNQIKFLSINSVSLINVIINIGYECFCSENFFSKFFVSKTFSQNFFFEGFTVNTFPFTDTKRTLYVSVLWKIW